MRHFFLPRKFDTGIGALRFFRVPFDAPEQKAISLAWQGFMAAERRKETLEGCIDEVLPNALYRIRLADGRRVRCALSGSAKLRVVKLIEGDSVCVELSSVDPTRGKVVDVL